MRTADQQNRRYFRQAYETGTHGWKSDAPSPYLVRNLEAIAPQVPGGRLLDLGCGEGRHCLLAARMGFHPTGVDYEPLAIEHARIRAREEGLADLTEWLVADVLALPLAAGSFDVVIDCGCLHHQRKSDWGRYCASLLALLRPGGYYLLSVFSTAFRVYGPQERPWHLAHGAYRRFFTAQDLRQLFDPRFQFLELQEEREGVRGFWHALMQRHAT